MWKTARFASVKAGLIARLIFRKIKPGIEGVLTQA
jgi:hypothetical protein